MAIKFIDAVRANAFPCGHFTLTIELDDLSTRSHTLTLEDLNNFLNKLAHVIGEGSQARQIALGLLWIGYQRDHGATIGQMRDKVIAEPL